MKKLVAGIIAMSMLSLTAYAAEQRTVFKLWWGKSVVAEAKRDHLEVTTLQNVIHIYPDGRVLIK